MFSATSPHCTVEVGLSVTLSVDGMSVVVVAGSVDGNAVVVVRFVVLMGAVTLVESVVAIVTAGVVDIVGDEVNTPAVVLLAKVLLEFGKAEELD